MLLAPGLIRPYKGLIAASHAMAHLDDRYRLVIAGPANDPAHLAEVKAATDRDRRRIVLLPRSLSDQEFADLHEAADCVLLPYSRITTSAALITALTLRRGVVVSDLPYFHEVLDAQPGCAEFARPDDAADLAAAIQRFFEGPENRSQAARRLADTFAWDTVVEPVARRILELCAERRCPPRP